jgi:hypothetical protein
MQGEIISKKIKLAQMATRLCGTSKDDNQGLVWKTKNPREHQYQPGQCILFPEGVCTDEFLSRKPGFLLSAMHSHPFRWFSAAPLVF